jgi:cytochrome c oxidase assembly protein Cox11
VLFLKPLFALYPLSPVWVMVTGILMAAAVPVFAVMCRLVLLQVQRQAKHSKKFRERLGRHFKS